jgi:hypothetical protein
VPATAATVGDRVMLAWIQKRRGDIPGGLRTSWLGGRGTPQVDAVTSHDDVLALEAAPWGEDRAVLAWTEVDKLSSRVLWALDAGDPVPALDKLDDASSLRLVSDGTTTRLVGVGLAGDVCVDKLSAG